MMRWLAGAVGLMALVALQLLPPASIEMPPRRVLPERIRASELDAELSLTHAALRALRWSDSLSALAVRTAVDGLVLNPPNAAAMDADAVRAWEAERRAELTELEPRDPDMVVGSLWVPARQATLPGVPLVGLTREVTFAGVRDGTPYCIQAVPFTERSATPRLSYTPGPVACTLYAQYGLPGARVQEWMEASALGFARLSGPPFGDDVVRSEFLSLPPRRLFGLSRPLMWDENAAVHACLAGRAEACERAVTEPELLASPFQDTEWVLANSPAVDWGLRGSGPPFGYLDDALLYELEARFGQEAFRRFWTSDEPVPAAFEAAFSEPLGVWVLNWIERHVGLYRAGPSVPWGTLAWSFLALAGLAFLATASQARRQAG